jgi:hypothetical protein
MQIALLGYRLALPGRALASAGVAAQGVAWSGVGVRRQIRKGM